MKITTNFALPVRRTLLAVFLTSILVSIAGLMFVYYLGMDRRSLLEESTTMKRIASGLENKNGTLTEGGDSDLDMANLLETRRRIEDINALTPVKSVSVNQLLVTIEDSLPNGVSIDRLSYSALDGQLQIVAATDDADLIYLFMNKLEQNPMFLSAELQQKPGVGSYGSKQPRYEIHAVTRK